MNFQKLSDKNLDQEMIQSVKDETNATLKVLHLLREVDRRRLFSKLKYKSLVDYAERRLGYPYDQACRRVQAMRLLKEIPEIEEKIASGALNLSNIGYAQVAFKAEAKNETALSKEEKLEFLERIENKSTRATQKLVAEEFGKGVLLRETVKPITAEISMWNLPAGGALLAKAEKLKGLLAHSDPGITTAELIDKAFDELIAKLEKTKQSKVAAPRLSKNENQSAVGICMNEKNSASDSTRSRYIRASDNRELWKTSSACENCGSTYALERDHKIPFAKGGHSERTNLRVLCRSCNQRSAIESYGINKMRNYLRSPYLNYSA